MADLCVDCILLANAPLLEDGPWQGRRRFLQRKGFEPARMCLLPGLSQGVRHRQQQQNMILHLAGPQSHHRRVALVTLHQFLQGTVTPVRAAGCKDLGDCTLEKLMRSLGSMSGNLLAGDTLAGRGAGTAGVGVRGGRGTGKAIP